jgi:hypothetical protein
MTFINGTDLFVFANVAAQYGGINLMLSVAPINFQRSDNLLFGLDESAMCQLVYHHRTITIKMPNAECHRLVSFP